MNNPETIKELKMFCTDWSVSNLVRHYRKRLCAVIFSRAGRALIVRVLIILKPVFCRKKEKKQHTILMYYKMHKKKLDRIS